MSHSIFEQWASKSALQVAWYHVRRNGGAHGIDGITTKSFAQDAPRQLKTIRRNLRSGTYRPDRLLRFKVQKTDGSVRWLGIPTVRDRIVQTALSSKLISLLDPHMSDASFAYRPNRSVETAAGAITRYHLQNWGWALRADIKSFFDEINHGILKDKLGLQIACRRTRHVIELTLRQGGRGGRGVAQGSPLSPVLANWMLTDFDHHFHRGQTRLVRFADDFLILTKKRRVAENAQARCVAELRDIGLRLNRDKTGIHSFEEGFPFLGLWFCAGSVSRLQDQNCSNGRAQVI